MKGDASNLTAGNGLVFEIVGERESAERGAPYTRTDGIVFVF